MWFRKIKLKMMRKVMNKKYKFKMNNMRRINRQIPLTATNTINTGQEETLIKSIRFQLKDPISILEDNQKIRITLLIIRFQMKMTKRLRL